MKQRPLMPIYSYLREIYRRRFSRTLIWALLGLFIVLSSGLFLINPLALSQIPIGQAKFREAHTYYYNGQLSDAITAFQEAADIFRTQGTQESNNLAITLTNLGRVQLEFGQPQQALDTWKETLTISRQLGNQTGIIRSQIYQAQALQQLGFYPRACETLTQTLGISSGVCQEREIPQELLEKQFKIIRKVIARNPADINIIGWRILGDNLRAIGKLEDSELILSSLENLLPSSLIKTTTQLSLGNTLRELGTRELERQASPRYDYMPWGCQWENSDNQEIPEKARKYYAQAQKNYQQASSSSQISTALKARINLASLLLSEVKSSSETQRLSNLLAEINNDLSRLPTSRIKVYLQIQLAKHHTCLANLKKETPDWSFLEKNLKIADDRAQKLDDKTSQSYVLGNWGGLYEYHAWWVKQVKDDRKNQAQYWKKAQDLTAKALELRQPQQDPQIAYQWQWQLGRLLEAQGKQEEAIAAYQEAAKTLELVRSNLLTVKTDVQFSFRDNVEPLYRGLVKLLLSPQTSLNKQQKIQQALYYIESLQLAELENFLRCDPQSFSQIPSNRLENKINYLDTFQQRIQAMVKQDTNAAIIYPIVLQDRLKIILLLDDKLLLYQSKDVTAERVNETIESLRQFLKNPVKNREVKKLNYELYQWLIKPIETELNQRSQLKTLVFVLDSALQNIPMSSLYDGEQYLIQKYAIVLAPSLQILDPYTSKREQISALVAGATNAPSFAQENLNSLDYVKTEIDEISQQVSRRTKLLEQDFVQSNVQEQINSVPFFIVHLATHGKFSSNPEETYILDWNQRLQVEDLDQLLRFSQPNKSQPIELLILSACETAKGDRRAALGLAGIALRAGVRSTIASLWQVDDASTAQLMIHFYKYLQNPQITKAEALQRAQLALLTNNSDTDYSDTDYNRSYYWAPFVLVGNWL